MNKLLDSLHTKILKSKFAEEVTEEEIDALVKAKEHNDDWIPVSERMPEDDRKSYIVQKTNGNIDILRFTKDAYKLSRYDFYEYKDKKKSLFFDYDSEYGYCEWECEAWQSLPKQYKRGE